MYNDKDMDVDDEDEEEQEEEEEEEEEEIEGGRNRRSDPMNEDAFPSEPFYGNMPPIIQSQTPIFDNDPTLKSPPSLTPQPQIPVSSPPPLPPVSDSSDVQRMRKGAFGIVDYAHDETAMSPDAEEGEIVSTGSVMLGRDLRDANGVYSLCDGPGLSHGPYLGTATLCSFISILILSMKACVVVAYRTSCRAQRKLLFHRVDPEVIWPLWRHYFQNTQGLIFVIDSNDKERISEARDELHQMLSEDDILLFQGMMVILVAQRCMDALTNEDAILLCLGAQSCMDAETMRMPFCYAFDN